MSSFNAGPAAFPAISGELTASKIRELMENAQKTIAQRKQEMGLSEIPAKPLLFHGMIADPQKSEKARRASELQARISARLDSGILKAPVQDTNKKLKDQIRNIIFDEHGKTIDAFTGEEIQIPHHTPTLKANVRAQKAQNFKEALQTTNQKKTKDLAISPYFDPRLSLKAAIRPRKHLTFYEKGKFIRMGQRLRIKAQLGKLQETVAEAAKKTGIASAAKLATIQPKWSVDESSVPEVEWWDAYILKPGVESYTELDQVALNCLKATAILNEAWITNLVEHPVKLKAPMDLSKQPEIPLLLTKKEKKKLRRQNRQEAQKERQEQVRLGLMSPPEPKVKLANLMRVLGSDAVQDPSKVEAYVRKQMESRKRAHEAANAARKLTKDQARFKRIHKIREDTSQRIHVSVYRIKDLSNPVHKFKVETNANQLFMTGIVALHRDCNVVVVEGGPKQQRKFNRLMTNRIKWNETKRGVTVSTKSEVDQTPSLCQLVWEGTVMQRAFESIHLKVCPTELFAREQFRRRDVEHYWDLAYSGAILESVGQNVL